MAASDHNDPERRPPDITLENAGYEDEQMQSLHESIMREKAEPTESYAQIPVFLIGLFGVLVFWAGFYFSEYSGGFDPMVYDETLAPGQQVAAGPVEFDPMAAGARFYSRNCVVCHQADGNGVPGAFPPMVASEWLQGTPDRSVKILLHGLQGEIVVKGNTYNGVMPAFATSSDRDIAAVLTYLRTDPKFENESEPVEEETVAQIRSEFQRTTAWDGDELLELHPIE